MNINIICIGKIKEKYLNDGINEFIKRLKVYSKLSITELNETKISNNPSLKDIDMVVNDEGKKILSKINNDSYLIVLDVLGNNITNNQYVKIIEKALVNGYSTISFVIGGSYGISQEVIAKAHFRWSFSSLVFTHQMIRLILLEQIYRGFKIINNEPYHK